MTALADDRLADARRAGAGHDPRARASPAGGWPRLGAVAGPGLVVALAGALLGGVLGSASAQDGHRPSISVPTAIVAEPAAQTLLAIRIGPPDQLPKRSFVSLRGLPPSISLTEGHAIGPGSWAVPLAALPTLKANVPAGVSGRTEIVISLIGMDGRLLAEARAALVVSPAAIVPPQEKAAPLPQPEEAAPQVDTRLAAAAPKPLTAPRVEAAATPRRTGPEDRVRAERLLARGEEFLAAGNIIAARDFFERAAEAGVAAAAVRMAATYDPDELRRLRAQGVAPDRALARKWYERARELGAPEAGERLARLGGD